ncbi:MAG: SRPBCC family protein [Hyphomicrobiaceae bacterium]
MLETSHPGLLGAIRQRRRLAHEGNPDMAKRTSSWVPLTAAVVASLVYAGTDDTGAYAAGAFPRACALWQPRPDQGDTSARLDLGLADGTGRSVAQVGAQVGNRDGLAGDAVGGTANEVKVRTALAPDGKTIQVVVALALPISRDVVWEVLGDYENMPHFVPDIRATRLIDVKPGRIRVEIEGVARLVFLEFPTSTTLDVAYPRDGSIAIDSVAGNLAVHGVVRVQGDGTSTRVDYQVRIAPDFWLPPLIGDFLIGRQIKRQFEAMVAEMHRRAASRQMEGRTMDRSSLAD